MTLHYEIKQYSIDQAKKYGFTVKVSSNKKKKLDVYKNGIPKSVFPNRYSLIGIYESVFTNRYLLIGIY